MGLAALQNLHQVWKERFWFELFCRTCPDSGHHQVFLFWITNTQMPGKPLGSLETNNLQESPCYLHQYLNWRWINAMGGWEPYIHYQLLLLQDALASHRAAGPSQNFFSAFDLRSRSYPCQHFLCDAFFPFLKTRCY